MKTIEELTARLKRRSVATIADAIGATIRVRLDERTKIFGTVVAAEFAGVRNRGESLIAKFKVTVESGAAKARHIVHLESLPKREG